jgi:hypothetical protein
MRLEKPNIPAPSKGKINARFRNFESDIDAAKRKLESLSSDRRALFGSRYTDNPTTDDQLEQRQQLLSGTERLGRSSGRLRESQRIALETEDIGAGTLSDLQRQRETIMHTRATLHESEGYTDRSIKTLRGMARRYVDTILRRAGVDAIRVDRGSRFYEDGLLTRDDLGWLRIASSRFRSSQCWFCLLLRLYTANSDRSCLSMCTL